jgi:glycosyltransferase involved in cell wall biosynthesis
MAHLGTATVPPRVSVVIPCYRQAHFLPEALGSARAQTHPAYEIVVVDDGSPDDVPSAVAAFPGVRCLTQENRGLGAARNAGLADCSGDAVVFLDADDRLLPEALAVGRAALVDHPTAAFVWGFNRPIDGKGRPLGSISNPWAAEVASYADLLARNVVGPPVGAMFRRSAVVDCGGFSAGRTRAEDYDLYLRLARDHDIRCHGRLVAEYRYHDAKMSGDDRGMLEGVLAALDAQEEYVRHDAALRRAWREGRRWAWRLYDGRGRIEAIGNDLRGRRWARAGAAALRLMLRDPALLVQAVRSRTVRHRSGGAES